MTLAEAVVSGSGQFWIQDGDTFPPVETWDQSNGLVVLASRPSYAEDGYALGGDVAWDEIVEASVTCREGPLRVCSESDGFADLPRLDSTGPGTYRLRVHAINRNRPAYDADGFAAPTDRYLIVAWPEPPAPPVLIRVSDRRGCDLRMVVWLKANGWVP